MDHRQMKSTNLLVPHTNPYNLYLSCLADLLVCFQNILLQQVLYFHILESSYRVKKLDYHKKFGQDSVTVM